MPITLGSAKRVYGIEYDTARDSSSPKMQLADSYKGGWLFNAEEGARDSLFDTLHDLDGDYLVTGPRQGKVEPQEFTSQRAETPELVVAQRPSGRVSRKA